MTCSAAIRRTGPLSARKVMVLVEIGSFSRSACRVIEIAFITNEVLPASIARLFDAGSQVNTSGVSDSWNSAFMNLSDSIVALELRVTLPASSCSAPPNDHSSARIAMLVSSCCDRPIPHGLPALSRIFLQPARRSSHVSGPLGKPASVHRSLCQLPGSGTYESENAKYFLVFGLYVDRWARSIFLPCLRSTSW